MIKGFTDKVPGDSAAMSFHRKSRAELGGLNIMNISGADGAILKSHGMYEKVIYRPKERELRALAPVLVYLGPGNDFSEYTKKDIESNSLKYWWSSPLYGLDFLDKILLVLPCPKRLLTAREAESILKFISRNGRIVIFAGENMGIASGVLTQLGSRLEYLANSPAITGNLHIISGKLPDGELFWTVGGHRYWIGVKQLYWPEATVRDFYGYGIAYNNITSLSPWWRGFGPGAFTADNWFNRFGYHIYSTSFLQVPEWPYITVKWSDLLFYPVGYIPYTYVDMLMTEFQPWISANATELPMYYINTGGEPFYQKTYFKYGYYFNYSETASAGSIYQSSTLAYVDGEGVVACSFKPSFLSNTLVGSYDDLDKVMKIKEFAWWLVYGKRTLAPNLFNTKNYVMPTPHTFGSGGIDGTGQVIQYP